MTTTAGSSDDVTTDDPSPTAQEIPDLEAPSVPPEMQVDDATGAAAATWYFFELYDYARATGDTALFEAMMSDDCAWCGSVVEQIRGVYEDGGIITGADLTFDITAATVELPVEERPYYALAMLDAVDGPFTVVDGAGETSSC